MEIKRIALWVVIAILAIGVIYVAFFRGGGVDQSTVGAASQVVKSSYSGMVGGC